MLQRLGEVGRGIHLGSGLRNQDSVILGVRDSERLGD